MKIKRIFAFLVIFLILAGFSAVSLGLVDSRNDFIASVSAKELDVPNSVSFLEPPQSEADNFMDKILRFLRREVVCEVTEEQQLLLENAYETETKTFDVDGSEYSVLIIKEKQVNKNIIEQVLGTELGKCQVVQGLHKAALLTSFFVS